MLGLQLWLANLMVMQQLRKGRTEELKNRKKMLLPLVFIKKHYVQNLQWSYEETNAAGKPVKFVLSHALYNQEISIFWAKQEVNITKYFTDFMWNF